MLIHKQATIKQLIMQTSTICVCNAMLLSTMLKSMLYYVNVTILQRAPRPYPCDILKSEIFHLKKMAIVLPLFASCTYVLYIQQH